MLSVLPFPCHCLVLWEFLLVQRFLGCSKIFSSSTMLVVCREVIRGLLARYGSVGLVFLLSDLNLTKIRIYRLCAICKDGFVGIIY